MLVYWDASSDPRDKSIGKEAKLLGGPLQLGEPAEYRFRIEERDELFSLPAKLILYSAARDAVLARFDVDSSLEDGD